MQDKPNPLSSTRVIKTRDDARKEQREREKQKRNQEIYAMQTHDGRYIPVIYEPGKDPVRDDLKKTTEGAVIRFNQRLKRRRELGEKSEKKQTLAIASTKSARQSKKGASKNIDVTDAALMLTNLGLFQPNLSSGGTESPHNAPQTPSASGQPKTFAYFRDENENTPSP